MYHPPHEKKKKIPLHSKLSFPEFPLPRPYGLSSRVLSFIQFYSRCHSNPITIIPSRGGLLLMIAIIVVINAHTRAPNSRRLDYLEGRRCAIGTACWED